MDDERLVIVGVRHHSPACARLAARTITDVQPAFVLIEGPADFNPHLGDLRLPHRLPVAIFSFHAGSGRVRASYAPFCNYSPEWQALRAAWATGAEPVFCDLPSWHPDFGDRDNRYADPHGLMRRHRAATDALARALGAEGYDALWDVLAEGAEDAALPGLLDTYWSLLRPPGTADPAEAAREAFMGHHAAWALARAAGRPVVLVCGGWHVGAVRAAARAADGSEPALPLPADGERAGSYLVPYGYERLDRFSGYAAGMPSPAYYGRVFEAGLADAADWAETAVTAALRAVGQVVSTADRIAWRAHAQALARARGHRTVLRADLLDAALATLLKDALDAPAGWGEARGTAGGGHPAVLAMLRALSGTHEGRLAPGTREPPLLADVEDRLHASDLMPGLRPRQVQVDWHAEAGRARAHVLHGLRVLDIPGVTRLAGPAEADVRLAAETFEVTDHRLRLGALIEASRWGATLPMAAAARLEARVEDAGSDLGAVAAALSDALLAGLLDLAPGLVQRLRDGIARCHDVGALGRAGRQAERTFRFGEVFAPDSRAGLGAVCEAVFARALWLLEGTASEAEGARAVDAVLACRDLVRGGGGLRIDRAAALDTFRRLAGGNETPAALAGAALGFLVAGGDAAAATAAGRVRRFGRPDRLGDFLVGLFALAREEVGTADDVLGAVEALVAAWTAAEFLRALPAMRHAFSWFPPRERERLARAVLRHHGRSDAGAEIEALGWMRQHTPVGDQATALALEDQVAERLRRCGLL